MTFALFITEPASWVKLLRIREFFWVTLGLKEVEPDGRALGNLVAVYGKVLANMSPGHWRCGK